MIEAAGLSKRYGSTLAVDDLSFTVPPGQVTGFLGPNGAGKSTTMRLILGLDAPTSGTVTVNGRPYASYRRPLFQAGALLEASAADGGRSAYNHLLCLALSNGIGRARVSEVLGLVGLRSVARRRTGGFSLGMSQRLGIAAALLGDPPVLLFDEPVTGLDPDGVVWIRNLLKSLAAEGRTVFLSSHLMSEMSMTADRLIIIGRGRLIAQASMEDFATLLRAQGAMADGQPDGTLRITGATPGAVGELARANDITLAELSAHQASLEDRYMELTKDSADYRTAGDALVPGGK